MPDDSRLVVINIRASYKITTIHCFGGNSWWSVVIEQLYIDAVESKLVFLDLLFTHPPFSKETAGIASAEYAGIGSQ